MVNIPKSNIKELEFIGKVILTIAMSAIGLKVSVPKLIKAGGKGLRFGLVMFAFQIAALLLVVMLMR